MDSGKVTLIMGPKCSGKTNMLLNLAKWRRSDVNVAAQVCPHELSKFHVVFDPDLCFESLTDDVMSILEAKVSSGTAPVNLFLDDWNPDTLQVLQALITRRGGLGFNVFAVSQNPKLPPIVSQLVDIAIVGRYGNTSCWRNVWEAFRWQSDPDFEDYVQDIMRELSGWQFVFYANQPNVPPRIESAAELITAV